MDGITAVFEIVPGHHAGHVLLIEASGKDRVGDEGDLRARYRDSWSMALP